MGHDSGDCTENEHTFPFVRNPHIYQNSILAFHSMMILEGNSLKSMILQNKRKGLRRVAYFSTHTLPAPPITSSRAMILMPCFPNAGAFLLFLPVPFSSLCNKAANVTSSIAECTCNTQLKPALKILFKSSKAICASNAETQWTGRCGAQSTKPGKMSSSSTPRIRTRT